MARKIILIVWMIIKNSNAFIKRDGCGPGWDLPTSNLDTKEEYCYQFNYIEGMTFNWHEANRNCRQTENAELLVVETQKESDWLWNVFTNPTVDFTGIHKNDRSVEGWFVNAHRQLYNNTGPAWADGRTLDGLKGIFYGKIINGTTGVEHSCYYINIANGNLHSSLCAIQISKQGFICKRPQQPLNKINPQICSSMEAQNVTCPNG